jgi:hypothetical protein
MDRKRTTKIRSTEMEWLEENRGVLERDYAGQYVAVVGNRLVANGSDPRNVRREATEKGHSNALIHRVLPREFQGMKFVR